MGVEFVPSPPTPVNPRRRIFRRVAAIVAFILAAATILVELTSHICGTTVYDPLPDIPTVAAAVFVTLMLLGAEVALARAALSERESARKILSAFYVFSWLSLAITLVFAVPLVPLIPASVMMIIAFGLGLCGLTPFLIIGVAWAQAAAVGRALTESGGIPRSAKTVAAALCVAAVLWLAVRPLTAGFALGAALRSTTPSHAVLRTLRVLGGQTEALNMSYRKKLSFWAALGAGDQGGLYGGLFDWRSQSSSEQGRKMYYLITGRGFYTQRPLLPFWGPLALPPGEDEMAAEETGGEMVGSRIKGLELAVSRLEGKLDVRSETAHLTWTLIYRNNTSVAQEARSDIRVPEGGVVDGVSLWIDGEKREAAFGGKATVRKAYQTVAVVERRDPLLVTSKDPAHVMTQCFPIPPHKTMKISLQMSSPLIWRNPDNPRLTFTPPSLQQVNFDIPASLEQSVELHASGADPSARWSGRGWNAEAPSTNRPWRLSSEMGSAGIVNPPAVEYCEGRYPKVGDALGDGLVRKWPAFPTPTKPVDMVVAVDTVYGMEPLLGNRERLTSALAHLPKGSRVRFLDTRDPERPSGWTDAGQAQSDDWWQERRYVGGVDAAGALQEAVRLADTTSNNPGAVVWLHADTPPQVSDCGLLADALASRGKDTVLVGAQLRPGPDALMDEIAGAPNAFATSAREGSDPFADAVRLAALAARAEATTRTPLGGRLPAINGVATGILMETMGARAEQALAVFSHVLKVWYDRTAMGRAGRVQAAGMASQRRLVTPLTGAVVLETAEQYAENGLQDPSAVIPEPTGLLALGAGLAGWAGVWRVRRRRRGPVPASRPSLSGPHLPGAS